MTIDTENRPSPCPECETPDFTINFEGVTHLTHLTGCPRPTRLRRKIRQILKDS